MKLVKILALLVFLVIFADVVSAQPTKISSCTVIDQPGYYVLTSDIMDSAEDVCIKITASDVVLNGQGHKIDGIKKSNSYGIYVNGSTTLTNVTIKNVNLTDWDAGIYCHNVRGGVIENSRFGFNIHGMYLWNFDGGLITNNTIYKSVTDVDVYGIYLYNSTDTVITENNLSCSGPHFTGGDIEGIYLKYSSNVTVAKNRLDQYDDGIYLYYSDNNTIASNELYYYKPISYAPSVGDIFLSYSDNNTVEDNVVMGPAEPGAYSGEAGITLFFSNYTTVVNNTVTGQHYGFLVQSTAIPPTHHDLFENNTAFSNGIGFSILSGAHIILSNNNASLNVERGIELKHCPECMVVRNTVCHNGLYVPKYNTYTMGVGIWLDFYTVWNGSTVTIGENKVCYNSYGGIVVAEHNNVVLISNNNLVMNGFAENALWTDVYVYDDTKVIIVGNSFSRGVNIDPNSNVTFRNNTVNGRAMVFLDNESNKIVEDAGQVIARNSLNITVRNSNLSGVYVGVDFYNVSGSTIENCTISNDSKGISFSSSSNNVIRNSRIENNEYGIYISSSSNNTVANNTIRGNGHGLYLWNAWNNLVYNNLFSNTNNVSISGSYSNRWNVTLTEGKNIVGGNWLGGNYWANPSGSGFSETCTDGDGNGVCDSPFVIDANNVDYLPLSKPTPQDTTPPAITAEWSTRYVNMSNPLEITAEAYDDSGIAQVDFRIWDYNSLVSNNSTLEVIFNNSGVSGLYKTSPFPGPWLANYFLAKNTSSGYKVPVTMFIDQFNESIFLDVYYSSNLINWTRGHLKLNSTTLKTEGVYLENGTYQMEGYVKIVNKTSDVLGAVNTSVFNLSDVQIIPALVRDGNYTVIVSAEDVAGNDNETVFSVRVINPPQISLSTTAVTLILLFNGTAYQQNTTTITFNATDDTELANVTLEIYNSTSLVYRVTNSSVNSYFYQNTTDLTVTEPGTYKIVLKAYDIFGNFNSTTMYIYAIGKNETRKIVPRNNETEIKVAEDTEIVAVAGDSDAQINITFEESLTNETLNVPEPEVEPVKYINITGQVENVTVMKVRFYYTTNLPPLVYLFNKTGWELVDNRCLETNLTAKYVDINMTKLAEIKGYTNLSEFLADPVMALATSPDLTVESISVNPLQPKVNQRVTISVRINNTGDANATAFNVSIYLNDNLLKEVRIDNLNVSEVKGVIASWTPTSAGRYTIRAFVDSKNEIAEIDETNNEKAVNVTVSAISTGGGGTTGGGGGYIGGGGSVITPKPTPTATSTQTPTQTETTIPTPTTELTPTLEKTPTKEETPAKKENKGLFGIPGFEILMALISISTVLTLRVINRKRQ